MQRSNGRVLSPLLRAVARWGSAPRASLGCDLNFARGMSGTFVKPPDLKGDNIDVMPRTGTGKTVTKRLRAEGLVPGILFGPGDDHGELLQMPKEDVERLVRIYGLSGIGARVITLNYPDGARKEDVVAKQVIYDAINVNVENVNFMPCKPETEIKVKIPVRVEGEDACPGIKRGGFAWKLHRTLTVTCKGGEIPTEIVSNIAGMDVGDKVFLRDLNIPEGVTVHMTDDNVPIIKIAGKAR